MYHPGASTRSGTLHGTHQQQFLQGFSGRSPCLVVRRVVCFLWVVHRLLCGAVLRVFAFIGGLCVVCVLCDRKIRFVFGGVKVILVYITVTTAIFTNYDGGGASGRAPDNKLRSDTRRFNFRRSRSNGAITIRCSNSGTCIVSSGNGEANRIVGRPGGHNRGTPGGRAATTSSSGKGAPGGRRSEPGIPGGASNRRAGGRLAALPFSSVGIPSADTDNGGIGFDGTSITAIARVLRIPCLCVTDCRGASRIPVSVTARITY